MITVIVVDDEGTASSTTLTGRAEPQSESGHGLISGPDGMQISPKWVVYLPLPVPEIVVGAQVEASQDGNLLLSDTVKRFSRGQLNARVWL